MFYGAANPDPKPQAGTAGVLHQKTLTTKGNDVTAGAAASEEGSEAARGERQEGSQVGADSDVVIVIITLMPTKHIQIITLRSGQSRPEQPGSPYQMMESKLHPYSDSISLSLSPRIHVNLCTQCGVTLAF